MKAITLNTYHWISENSSYIAGIDANVYAGMVRVMVTNIRQHGQVEATIDTPDGSVFKMLPYGEIRQCGCKCTSAERYHSHGTTVRMFKVARPEL